MIAQVLLKKLAFLRLSKVPLLKNIQHLEKGVLSTNNKQLNFFENYIYITVAIRNYHK